MLSYIAALSLLLPIQRTSLHPAWVLGTPEAGGQASQPSILDVSQGSLMDVSFTAKVIRGNQVELAKINEDFAQAFGFVTSEVKLRDPFMVRIDSMVEDTPVEFVVNGTTKLYRLPRSKLSQRANVAKKPGQRQTWLDFGIVTPSLFESLFQASYVSQDSENVTFDLTYQDRSLDTSRQRVWVDRVKRFVKRRDWYDQKGVLRATFAYSDPVSARDVWFPTRLIVRNAEGKVAGETEYREVKINAGIDASLFNVK